MIIMHEFACFFFLVDTSFAEAPSNPLLNLSFNNNAFLYSWDQHCNMFEWMFCHISGGRLAAEGEGMGRGEAEDDEYSWAAGGKAAGIQCK